MATNVPKQVLYAFLYKFSNIPLKPKTAHLLRSPMMLEDALLATSPPPTVVKPPPTPAQDNNATSAVDEKPKSSNSISKAVKVDDEEEKPSASAAPVTASTSTEAAGAGTSSATNDDVANGDAGRALILAIISEAQQRLDQRFSPSDWIRFLANEVDRYLASKPDGLLPFMADEDENPLRRPRPHHSADEALFWACDWQLKVRILRHLTDVQLERCKDIRAIINEAYT